MTTKLTTHWCPTCHRHVTIQDGDTHDVCGTVCEPYSRYPVDIDVFRVTQRSGGMWVGCHTCGRDTGNWVTPQYGQALFTPMHHDPHCPARNHVYLEGIGPMIEPRAMVFEKESDGKDRD